jgi:hypothetical protein
MWVMRLGVAGAASILFTGCGANMSEVATTDFAGRHPGCESSVVNERPDLSRPMRGSDDRPMTVYEVSGCNAHDIYACFPGEMVSRNRSTALPASCSKPDWCTPTGCWTVDVIARHQFATDKTCPLDRVTAAPHMKVPPADVAADPERTQMWAQAHPSDGATQTVIASGCGSEALYDCVVDVACKQVVPSGTSATAPSAMAKP